MIKKCLFPAAGYGTRFLPATKAMPKEMLPVLTRPLIEYGVEEAVDAGMKISSENSRAFLVIVAKCGGQSIIIKS